MDLKGILAIAGQPGLYKMISQAKNSIIVESLNTQKRMPAYATSKISALEDIAIYTYTEDIPLADVFKKLFTKESGGQAIDHKASANALKDYMTEILPDYDKDRVYVSDIKKIMQWYNVLVDLEMIDLEEPAEETDENETEESDTSTDENTDQEAHENKE
jgi:hypothetical protein